MTTKRFSIGYALLLKKQKSFIQDSLVNLSKQRGIDLVKIDTDKPLINQGPFDCVLHKLSNEDWKTQLRDYLIQNPNCIVIDFPDAIERLHNRVSMLDVVSGIMSVREEETETETETVSFGVPKQVVVYEPEKLKETTSFGEGFNLKNSKFPVIAKPLVADGSAKSHKMLLVFSNEGFENIKNPTVVQEFVNHGGVIFKVYVVGKYVKCVKRKSLPDITEEKLGGLRGSLSFSQVSNVTKNDRNMNDGGFCYKMLDLEDAVMPPLSLVTDIARGLRKAMKLHLFNFDMIRDTKVGNRYLVIDINYFPGYAKMPGYESVLTDFFWDVLNKKEARLFDCEREVMKLVVDNDGEDNVSSG